MAILHEVVTPNWRDRVWKISARIDYRHSHKRGCDWCCEEKNDIFSFISVVVTDNPHIRALFVICDDCFHAFCVEAWNLNFRQVHESCSLC